MARTVAKLPSGARLTDFVSLGVLADRFPLDKVHEILQQTERKSQRQRHLPAHVVVYYVIALALYMEVCQRSPKIPPPRSPKNPPLLG